MTNEIHKIVVLSGAGISAESGIHTFRDSGGLWEEHRIEDVATPEAWDRHPEVVLDFYNTRYRQLLKVKPNRAHLDLVNLEDKYDVTIVTQNVDDLHERAGSSKVIHLHGELLKCRSEKDEKCILDMPEGGLQIGDFCPSGYQLRPHVVWFGEPVPEMDRAISTVEDADVLLVIGTSLNVYPAAGLAYATKANSKLILIDPARFDSDVKRRFRHVVKKASVGVREIVEELMH